MSLREEITKELFDEGYIDDVEFILNKTFEKIEKRIDEFIKQEDERAEDMIYDIDSYSSSYAVMVLKKFKEMLK